MSTPPLLTVDKVSCKHGSEFLLQEISFSLEAGHKLAVIGETGSGKTTLMRIVGGMGQADSGEVHFAGSKVEGIGEKLLPGHKGIAYLSQQFELRDHYRVSELLNYANNLTDGQSEELYRICRVAHLLSRWSHTLSGGEKQRVALAKLLTESPRLLLLDEPFSNLDQIHKRQLKSVIDHACEYLGLTCMMISHDGEDILPWADEVLVMREGRLLASATPAQLYQAPATPYIAGLFGAYSQLSPALREVLGFPDPGIVRPEQLMLAEDTGLAAIVQKCLYYGAHYELELRIAGELLLIRHEYPLEPGSGVLVRRRTIS